MSEAAYKRVEDKLLAGMVEGQMHACLRDIGRLAGGMQAGGFLTPGDMAALESLAVSLSINKQEGAQKWQAAVDHGRAEPIMDGPRDRRHCGVVDFGQDAYVDGEAPGGWDQAQDLIRYLRAVYRDGEGVNIVAAWTQKAGGKYNPKGWGVTRKASELIEAIKEQGDIAIGDYTRNVGVWVRPNPMDGKGVSDGNVTDCRHVVIECDTMPVDQQRAIIEELRLPCTAVVESGNKSIHAIVRVDAGTDIDLYHDRFDKLTEILSARGFDVDTACRNPSRLSRLPGVWRGDRRQWLIGTNTGCASWGEWLDYLDGVQRRQHDIGDLSTISVSENDDSLILPRFLTREGSWLIVASSGVGKSSMTMQHAMGFALGRPVFGLEPARPLRSLIVQAENCELDLAEQVQGVIKGEDYDNSDVEEIRRRIVLISEDSRCGPEFHSWLDRTISAHIPLDLVWLDPLLAFLGTGVNEQAEVTKWLRNGLNPIIHRTGVAVCVLHHTGKIRKQSQDDDYFMDYIGAGTSDLTNWARSVSFAERTGVNPTVVDWQHGKRGGRLPEHVRKMEIRHSKEGIIHWVTCATLTEAEKLECYRILDYMPPLKNRANHDLEDSMHGWARRKLGCSPYQADKLMDTLRTLADRKARGKWDRPVSIVQSVDSNRVLIYTGARFRG